MFGTGGPREMLDLSQRVLTAIGLPQYRTPEQAARAACALVDDAVAQALRLEAHVAELPVAPPLPSDALDEDRSKQLLEAMGVATPRRSACAGARRRPRCCSRRSAARSW